MIKKGETLLTEKPFIFVLKSSLRTNRCNYCFTLTELKKCSNCHYVYYCGKNCQKIAWSLHKLECNNLLKIRPKIIPDSAHLLIRIFLKLKHCQNFKFQLNENQEIVTRFNVDRTFKNLMSHVIEIKQDLRRMEHFKTLFEVMHSFFDDSISLNESKIFEMFGKMCINSFNILDNDMNSIGTGIYLLASILDHSCEPNAMVVFEGTTLIIRVVKCIKDFQWEKIRISYIDVLNTTSERKNDLLSLYYFSCNCERCSSDEDILMNSMACTNFSCSGYVAVPESENKHIEVSCNLCNSKSSIEQLNNFFEVTNLSDYHIRTMKNKDLAYVDVCKTILNRQKGVLHEYNIRIVKILDLAFESSINLQLWDNAIEFGFKLLPAFRKYYRFYHPLVGLLNMKLLKLMILKNNAFEFKALYEEANTIISVTYGQSHSLYKTLQDLLR